MKKLKFHIKFIGLISLLLLVAVTICFLFENKASKKDVALLKKLTKLKFPASVEWEHIQIDCGLDYSIICSFLIPKKDISFLVQDVQTERDILWSKTERGLTPIVNLKWFRPDKLTNFMHMQTFYPKETTALEILYDDSKNDSDKTLVYLVWRER
jgi:hypothetical protein